MVKEFIKNRKNQNIAVVVDKLEESQGMVFLMHGFGCNKEDTCLTAIADCFKKNDYTVIKFDTTNTFGESEGDVVDATFTNFYEDLEDVIDWAKNQDWYEEPFVIAGHSLGGLCGALFSEKFSSKVSAVLLISTLISGSLASEFYPDELLEKWEKDGFYELESEGVEIKMGWGLVEDGLKYNILENAGQLTMPVLLISGENDFQAPVKHQKLLFNAIPGKKQLEIIKGAGHKFNCDELERIKILVDNWIKGL